MVRAPRSGDPVLRLARTLASIVAGWHRARLEGAHHVPHGPALLVGNHGLFGLETPIFFHLVLDATGRLPIGLADRNVFGRRPLCDLLARVGGVIGTAENARALLDGGHLVVCYPGGSREVFKTRDQAYRLQWERSIGFARVAITARAPIVPFAGLGVDGTFLNLGHVGAIRRRLGRYAVPLAIGLGPLPLPVKISFRVGPPIPPPDDPREAPALKRRVETAVRSLIRGAPDAPDEEADRDAGAASCSTAGVR